MARLTRHSGLQAPSYLAALSLLLSTAAAFQNTSPFFVVSSAGRPQQVSDPVQFASAASIDATVESWLSDCPVSNYIFVRQGCVASDELSGAHASPNVRRWLEDAGEERRWIVPQVIGDVDLARLERSVVDRCGARRMRVDAEDGMITVEDATTRMFDVEFNNLCTDDPLEYRESHLVRNDMFLSTLMSKIPKHESHAIIYTTSPYTRGPPPLQQEAVQQMEDQQQSLLDALEIDDLFTSTVHMDLRRDLDSHDQAVRLNSSLPLFERYQYFTPGLFVGFTVSFALLMILYVGLTAISSLQVSYFAFSKEMGPAAQRKQQQ